MIVGMLVVVNSGLSRTSIEPLNVAFPAVFSAVITILLYAPAFVGVPLITAVAVPFPLEFFEASSPALWLITSPSGSPVAVMVTGRVPAVTSNLSEVWFASVSATPVSITFLVASSTSLRSVLAGLVLKPPSFSAGEIPSTTSLYVPVVVWFPVPNFFALEAVIVIVRPFESVAKFGVPENVTVLVVAAVALLAVKLPKAALTP